MCSLHWHGHPSTFPPERGRTKKKINSEETTVAVDPFLHCTSVQLCSAGWCFPAFLLHGSPSRFAQSIEKRLLTEMWNDENEKEEKEKSLENLNLTVKNFTVVSESQSSPRKIWKIYKREDAMWNQPLSKSTKKWSNQLFLGGGFRVSVFIIVELTWVEIGLL